MFDEKVKVGIIGCGNISQAYFKGALKLEVLDVIACADLNMEAAKAKAEEYHCEAQTVEEILANSEVQLIINLTIPAVHAEVSLAALNAGKHVHCEKPLSVELEDAKEVLDLAQEKGLLVGCAPDTFMGAGNQTCRKLIDDGWLGEVIGGTAFMMSRGPENWHPNPAFFYQLGGGPMFDFGPYYITALVNLLGPVKGLFASTSKAFEERVVTGKVNFGKRLAVEVPTHYTSSLEFHSGANINLCISFDVLAHSHKPIELYGTEGSLQVPDPNTFGGPVYLWKASNKEWVEQSLSHPYVENSRSIGAADMAYAILSEGKHKHRANGLLAYHALEVMHAFEKSSKLGEYVQIDSLPEQPDALPLGLLEGRLI